MHYFIARTDLITHLQSLFSTCFLKGPMWSEDQKRWSTPTTPPPPSPPLTLLLWLLLPPALSHAAIGTCKCLACLYASMLSAAMLSSYRSEAVCTSTLFTGSVLLTPLSSPPCHAKCSAAGPLAVKEFQMLVHTATICFWLKTFHAQFCIIYCVIGSFAYTKFLSCVWWGLLPSHPFY
jgi:hypothetical protein